MQVLAHFVRYANAFKQRRGNMLDQHESVHYLGHFAAHAAGIERALCSRWSTQSEGVKRLRWRCMLHTYSASHVHASVFESLPKRPCNNFGRINHCEVEFYRRVSGGNGAAQQNKFSSWLADY